LVKGICLLTGEEMNLGGGEATLPTDNNWADSLIIELENQKNKIDEVIKNIKSLVY
jgi:ribosomal protein L12E/L44/L45/RPP1/RPP2